VLLADAASQADDYVAAIREELQNNEMIREAYWPAIKEASWRAGKIRLGNGCVIEAGSTGSRIRGRKVGPYRPTLIVIDDPESVESVTSATMRDHAWLWLNQDVMHAGAPETNYLALGTALHREAMLCRLQTQPGWKTELWKSLSAMPQRLDLWQQWEELLHNYDDADKENTARTFFDANKVEMTLGAVALWPEREDVYQLMLLRASVGPAAFESEKQNNPTDPAACEWPAEYFNWPGLMFETWPEKLTHRVIALDPSKGKESKRGDYSAIVLGGMDERRVTYYECDLERRNTEKMLADMLRHVHRFKPDEIAIETNQYQELLVQPLRDMAKEWNVELPPIVQLENMTNKLLRIRRLGPDLAQRSARFKARSPGTTLTMQQGMDFPNGSHDDGIDGCEMARRRMKARGPQLDLR
jgi:hypothetical protein